MEKPKLFSQTSYQLIYMTHLYVRFSMAKMGRATISKPWNECIIPQARAWYLLTLSCCVWSLFWFITTLTPSCYKIQYYINLKVLELEMLLQSCLMTHSVFRNINWGLICFWCFLLHYTVCEQELCCLLHNL